MKNRSIEIWVASLFLAYRIGWENYHDLQRFINGEAVLVRDAQLLTHSPCPQVFRIFVKEAGLSRQQNFLNEAVATL